MPTYIHELPDWPSFRWDEARIAVPLASTRLAQGRLLGQMDALGFQLREEAVLRTVTQDVLKTSEIEGEVLDPDQVRSSVATRLGIDIGGVSPVDRHVDGVVEMMLDATQRYDQPLTAERLWGWHASLFPTPSAERLDVEMRAFLEWFNREDGPEPVLKAALAHLWFITVHPFDDGNGRIARALADLALARSEQSPQRFYSMSAQIREERSDYYDILERTQSGTLDVTSWMFWFLGCLTRAIERAQTTLTGAIDKAHYWERIRHLALNARQRQMITRLLDGFEGNLTTSKWATLTKSSTDTALRDIQQLVERGVLVRNAAGGRSTSYSVVRE